ncbi:YidB family protein [Yinghuangia soli]|uniref:YidB family protein n=1 Tax=Yinghuangia soli TaxID=2908204 RepID=A0AA41PZ79_9ACTN|nr:YidB family protein [Yinghuangia soli]MCF2528307.1 YidB family protein [Yinghuangia soli]
MGAANLGGLGNLGSLGGLLGGLLGGSGGGQNPLLKVVLGMLQGGGSSGGTGGAGGLGGLLEQLQAGGLGSQAKSWVDNGRNQPVSGQEITTALGEQELDRLAGEAGMTREETAAGIAAALPQVVNAVTPDGEVPPENDLDQALGQFLSETGGAPAAGAPNPDGGGSTGETG